MQAVGDDLSKARDIDFNHVFAKDEEAKRFVEAVQRLGHSRASYVFWEEKKLWDARVVVFMVRNHADVTSTESKLDAIAREFLGRGDGWGCLAVT